VRASAPAGSTTDLETYNDVRTRTERLRAPLAVEDCVIQSMPDVSPTKWHMAHTTWFFENFVCKRAIPGYELFDPSFDYLFNSYYNSVGPQFPRPERGLLSRPTVAQVERYRSHVDAAIRGNLFPIDGDLPNPLRAVFVLGLQHEQQHQELMLTDVKHVLSRNPTGPAYRPRWDDPPDPPAEFRWIDYPEEVVWIGYEGGGFAFDNEGPRHRRIVPACALAARPVTNGDYLAFIRDHGYTNPLLWLSEGWRTVREKGWDAPLYWTEREGRWWTFTLSGLTPVNESEPVCHVSYFEADAFARWAGARLPTESEWERAARSQPIAGNFAEDERFHPAPLSTQPPAGEEEAGEEAGSICGRSEPRPGAAVGARVLHAIFGSVWEWTSSDYGPYPGYAPPPGALGEYNGKFMCNQYVLRGGSCATPVSHIRATYRNFFPPDARWQFSGIRLAMDKEPKDAQPMDAQMKDVQS
jgi:ergothioneine biosynthesis protein EgtB